MSDSIVKRLRDSNDQFRVEDDSGERHPADDVGAGKVHLAVAPFLASADASAMSYANAKPPSGCTCVTLSVGGAPAPSGSTVVAIGTTGQLQISNSGEITASGSITTTNAPISAGTGALSGGSLNVGSGAISGGAISGVTLAIGSAGQLSVNNAGQLTVPLISFTPPPGDPSPVITARTVPSGQGASNERTELIIFHGNDGSNGSGPDLITLRAPEIRLQTYNDPTVTDINNNNGSNDRLVIDPNGNVLVNGNPVVVAPAETLRTFRGIVNPDGTVLSGSGFVVARVSTGLYDVVFEVAFTSIPSVTVTQIFPGDVNNVGGSTLDNAVVVGITTNKCRIKTGDSTGIASDRQFSFIAMGN